MAAPPVYSTQSSEILPVSTSRAVCTCLGFIWMKDQTAGIHTNGQHARRVRPRSTVRVDWSGVGRSMPPRRYVNVGDIITVAMSTR